jgi:hypothetical protein
MFCIQTCMGYVYILNIFYVTIFNIPSARCFREVSLILLTQMFKIENIFICHLCNPIICFFILCCSNKYEYNILRRQVDWPAFQRISYYNNWPFGHYPSSSWKMDDVQKVNYCTNEPSSQTFSISHWLFSYWVYTVPFNLAPKQHVVVSVVVKTTLLLSHCEYCK